MVIKNIGVLGAGLMGSGIAQVAAASGYHVTIVEVDDELVKKGLSNIEKSLAKLVEKSIITAGQKNETMARLRGTTRLEDLADSDIVIEAIVENLQIKRETYQRLDQICRAETIFASNTSSLSITEMMTATSPERQRRFVGMHFFNPVPLMKLVEVIRTILTDERIYEEAIALAQSFGKTVVRASDKTGFIVNRLLVPYLLDGIRVFEEGLASIADIDSAMKLGCHHPMGPLELTDFIGLDTTLYIANTMFDEFK
ncbi:MAG: 3-hydroxyacyl-CoA dehydrogenase NAD-binding domain-containing protein, partial [Acidobacteria bacterium]|nr:3-hydroxyacyl-CoA dehydrogenase NAD-binding domain-containing protein [Acidobacteriota bacterium]